MRNIHRADDVFVQKAKNSRDDPIMGNISSKLIATKEVLEKSGLMDSKQFSGFGAESESENSDPCSRLRSIVQQQYKSETKKDKRKIVKHGGLGPIAMVALPALGALAGELAKDLYSLIKSKITGSGIKMPYHKTKKQRIEFLKDVVNKL